MDQHSPDPVRQRLGRLGALTVHARGRTNTGPARTAWEAALAAEFGISDELSESERRKRLSAALRVRMSRLARARWNRKDAGPRDRADAPMFDRCVNGYYAALEAEEWGAAFEYRDLIDHIHQLAERVAA
jgi:hypothetical protein